MVSLRLENDRDSLDMAEVETDDYGIQAIAGATGFGLPPVELRWGEGAADGATFRGSRVLPRPMDIPIYIRARGRDELKHYASRVAQMFAGPCRLVFVEGRDDDEWYLDAVREGGGDWTFGTDTDGIDEARIVVTLKAGEPLWTSRKRQQFTVQSTPGAGLLTGSLVNLKLSSAQGYGVVTMLNEGDADAYPVWELKGPGRNFMAISPSGEKLNWTGTLAAGRTLTINTAPTLCTVIDDLGVDRYDGLATRPQFWTLPKGESLATVSMQDTTPGVSKITCTWQARRWVSI